MAFALSLRMGAQKLEQLIAWQRAHEFKIEIYRIAKSSPAAMREVEYRSQLFGAAASGESNVAEGFYRFAAADFARFLGMARASMGEARVRLLDGVDRGFFQRADCEEALRLADRAMACAVSLKTSLEPFMAKRSANQKKGRGPGT
jgi:four helix bundle protein